MRAAGCSKTAAAEDGGGWEGGRRESSRRTERGHKRTAADAELQWCLEERRGRLQVCPVNVESGFPSAAGFVNHQVVLGLHNFWP